MASINPAEPQPQSHNRWHVEILRAEALAQGRKWSQAITCLKRAIRAGADPYRYGLRIAEHYRALERWKEALSFAEQAAALAPQEMPAYEAIVAIALETGKFERAIEACTALIKLNPRHLPAYTALGHAYMHLGVTDAAMRVTNILIRLDPATPSHHFKKALLCQHHGEVGLAVYELKRTIELDPGGPHADAAQNALQTLDAFQLEQIVTLAQEDRVFRTKLERDPENALNERGFALSDYGTQVLSEWVSHPFLAAQPHGRPMQYN